MSERDEFDVVHSRLMTDIRKRPEYVNNRESAIYGYSEGAEHALDIMRILGYRKPRTITTAEELDALHDGAVIIDKFGDVSQLRGGEWCGYETAPLNSRTIAKWLPATVLHESVVTS